eukprot:6204977-Pleurochrysis_carterae.AAC.6
MVQSRTPRRRWREACARRLHGPLNLARRCQRRSQSCSDSWTQKMAHAGTPTALPLRLLRRRSRAWCRREPWMVRRHVLAGSAVLANLAMGSDSHVEPAGRDAPPPDAARCTAGRPTVGGATLVFAAARVRDCGAVLGLACETRAGWCGKLRAPLPPSPPLSECCSAVSGRCSSRLSRACSCLFSSCRLSRRSATSLALGGSSGRGKLVRTLNLLRCSILCTIA